jgi:hypothetical protein
MSNSATQNETRQTMSRLPCQRDFEIFRMAEILGLTHAEIARTSIKLTRRRVSQIVARVRRWLSLHPCQDPRLASELQRKQLARHTERMHLEHVISKARDELICGKQELTTTTTKDDGSTTTTVRQQPFNVQVLKTYLRAVQELAKLQQQPDVNLPLPEESQFPWLEGALNEVWDKWSGKVWSGNLKPKGIAMMVDEMVAAVLQAVATQAGFASQQQGEAPDQPEGCVQSAPMDETHQSAIDSLSTQCSEPSTQEPSHEDDDPNPKSKIQNRESASDTSLASQREAPASEPVRNDDDAATPCASETSTPSLPDKTTPPTLTAPQENPKREALPPPISPSLCPSALPSPIMSPDA